jgi:hypothetical protein
MTVVLHMGLCCFRSVMRGMLQVPMRRMRVMRRRQMVVSLVMFRGFAMVPRPVFVMLRRLMMMLCCSLGHALSQARNLSRGARRYRLSVNGV